jgi:hypothetical protein
LYWTKVLIDRLAAINKHENDDRGSARACSQGVHTGFGPISKSEDVIMKNLVSKLEIALILAFLFSPLVFAQEAPAGPDSTSLAKQTQNPVADLISIPFQFNFNTGGDLNDATLFNMNFQPVIPFRLTEDWNIVARTILPFLNIPGPDGSRFSGIGDLQQQVFFSPSKPGKLIWGVGPIFSLPTATTAPAETGSWGAGPTFVALTMKGPWVIGALANNVWTFADSGDSTEVNQFLLQPFINYNFGKGWALAYAPIITANWDAPSGNEWTVPVGIGISRTVVFNKRPMSLSAQYYHNAKRPDGSAANQLRIIVSLLYPKGK